MTFLIGRALIELRKSKGYTQQEVADLLHVSRQAYSGWKHNECDLSFSKLVDLTEVYQISIRQLVQFITSQQDRMTGKVKCHGCSLPERCLSCCLSAL